MDGRRMRWERSVETGGDGTAGTEVPNQLDVGANTRSWARAGVLACWEHGKPDFMEGKVGLEVFPHLILVQSDPA